MVCRTPGQIGYAEAAVLPLGIATAAAGSFGEAFLGLEFSLFHSVAKGQTLLIWEGSTSVGCKAIQLAVAAGYEVISTSSSKNFEMVKKLDATEVFDYNSLSLVEDIVKSLKGKQITGAFAICAASSPSNGSSAGEAYLEIVKRSEGRKFMTMAMVGPAESAPEGVEAKFVESSGFKSNEVGQMLCGGILPKVLAVGKFVCAPEALVIGHGVEKIQEASNQQKEGLSGRKIVVTM